MSTIWSLMAIVAAFGSSSARSFVLAPMLVLLVGAGVSPVCLGGEVENSGAFYVIAQTDTLLAGRDIESYNRATGRLVLTFDGYFRWVGFIEQLVLDDKPVAGRTTLSQRPFRIEYRGRTVLEGSIRSGLDSDLLAGVTLFDSDQENYRARLSLHYWKFLKGMGPSPLETDLFLEYFEDSGKLVDWQIRW